MQAACREWSQRQALALDGLACQLGGSAQLLQAASEAESAAPRSSMLRVCV